MSKSECSFGQGLTQILPSKREGAGTSRELMLLSCPKKALNLQDNVEAFIIRIGFWGALYYNYKKEPQYQLFRPL